MPYILVLLLLLASCAQTEPSLPTLPPTAEQSADTEAEARRQTITLATWNLDWLNETGQPSIPGAPKRGDEDYKALQRYGKQLKADVIAFQEVSNTAAIKRVLPDSEYEYVIGTHGNKQKVGYAIKKGLPWKANLEFEALDINGDLRSGVDITLFPDARPLRLLAVHLKSRCPDRPLDSGEPHCPSLKQQVPILEQWIDARAIEPIGFIVLGVFNRHFGDTEEFWKEVDDGQPPNAELERTPKDLKPGCWHGKHEKFVDYFVSDRRATSLVIQGSFKEWLYSDEDLERHKDGLSDHCPLTLRVSRP